MSTTGGDTSAAAQDGYSTSKTRDELSVIRRKLRGDLPYEDERQSIQRGCKVVPVTEDIQSFLKEFSTGVFVEEGSSCWKVT
jgi:hypothetical protein